jgi:hypothetical protein
MAIDPAGWIRFVRTAEGVTSSVYVRRDDGGGLTIWPAPYEWTAADDAAFEGWIMGER